MRRVITAPLLALSIAATPPAPKTAPDKPVPAAAKVAMSASPIGARTYGPRLEGFDYPFPVREYRTVAQGQSVEMAYMEVAPAKSNGRTVVLLHGKNFCGATWGDTARVLAAAGYRVIVPDQIGFCKSSKPTGFQYSLYGMATMTADLLRSRGVTKATLVGHSLGGMIAERLAIAQPQLVDQMILVDPLGLADRMAQGVPYITIDKAADLERRKTPASMKTYQLSSYYHGVWRRDYDRWVDMMAGMYAGPGRDAVIDAQARTTEMIETQPTAYEFGRITVPTILMVGTLDHNVFGRNWAPPEVANQLPEASTLGDKAAARMKDARFVPLQGLGHVPQIEDPARFQIALIQALSGAL
ncbi:alpha/beta fold hydrolase [Sphingomonas sp. MAH-6]|nr:alpha/beta hydrolase [Sphingomonas chungangi]MVW54678.1 alpha/beta fold hydrolase [Sphingomonas chungangi]